MTTLAINHVKVPAALLGENINGYSESGQVLKDKFHKQGKAFLKALASELSPELGAFVIRSNLGGMAVSGEVTLHSDHLYVQLSESCISRGVSMMFRSCTSQKDYAGGRNHFAEMRRFKEAETQATVLQTMLQLTGQPSERRADCD